MEKYIQAAETIVDRAVPKVSQVIPVRRMSGKEIKSEDGNRKCPRALLLRRDQNRRQSQDRYTGRLPNRG